MKQLPFQPWQQWQATRDILAAFALAGEEIRFVGGCVRDALIGRAAEEVDLATPATPTRVIELLAGAGIHSIPTGMRHGTVTAVAHGKTLEITTLRSDATCDGRHADVSFTRDWETDAQRRDFTVNALYADAAGTLFDYTGGLEDIAARKLRFIGDADLRVQEDYLRILRYFRFGAQLGWKIDDADALIACKAHAAGISQLSGERIHAEMFKLLGSLQCDSPLLSLMHETGVWSQVWPTKAIPNLDTLLANEKAFGVPPDPLARLAFLLGSDAKALGWLRERWKLSNAEYDALKLLQSHSLPADTNESAQKKLLRAVGAEMFRVLILLHADGSDAYRAMWSLADTWVAPAFPVTGQDLLDAGMQPGPALGQRLKVLEEAWEMSDYRLGKTELLNLR